MTPELYETFLRVKLTPFLSHGIDLPSTWRSCISTPNNLANYWGENLYLCRRGYVSPVWSRELTLKLMKQADEEGWAPWCTTAPTTPNLPATSICAPRKAVGAWGQQLWL